MPPETAPPPSTAPPRVNVADRLALHAAKRPEELAVVAIEGRRQQAIAFAGLDQRANEYARGLVAMGVRPGHRIALLVKPGIEFVALVFALLRSGATMVLVDGGLGRQNIVRCLESTTPDGFVAIPQGHALRVLMRKKFPQAKLNVTVADSWLPLRWFWGGETLGSLRKRGQQTIHQQTGSEPPASAGGALDRASSPPANAGGSLPADTGGSRQLGSRQPSSRSLSAGLPHTTADDPAAIVFTSGSTGPPKGVVYRHETFTTQCDEIQRRYDLRPGAVDLACFPLFGLFNVACGVTTVLPEMDFSRPASCDPKKLFAAANQWEATQSFASPAVWDRLSRHAERTGESIPTLRKVFSCGAPVPARVIRRTLAMVHSEAELHTPYGATESLPVATIEAQEILNETAAKTDEGAGVCVGKRFDSIEWRVIKITDDPIATLDETEEMPQGEIGELIVRGPQVSREYLSEPTASAAGGAKHNALAKITDGDQIWHRIGDVGYFDEQQRFWYCGRKSQRVVTSEGTLFTECVEGVSNSIQGVAKSALTGIEGNPQLVIETEFDTDLALDWLEDGVLGLDERGKPTEGEASYQRLVQSQIQSELAERTTTSPLVPALFHPKLPTDIRHNSKIRREELAVWASEQLKKRRQP